MPTKLSVSPRPWYKEPYVWLIIALPLSAVIGGIITIRLAIISDDGLVDDDYYQDGLAINQVLDRDNAARKLGLDANIELDIERQQIRIDLAAPTDFSKPRILLAHLMHATRKGFDQVVKLSQTPEGHYQGRLPDLPAGHWYIEIESGNWRLLKSSRISLPGKS